MPGRSRPCGGVRGGRPLSAGAGAEAAPLCRRELGLARSSSRARSSAGAAPGQRFGYLIVLDFEATCWRRAERRVPEISEWGTREGRRRPAERRARLSLGCGASVPVFQLGTPG